MTEWRDVVGWEGLYAVSDEGFVRNLQTGRDVTRTDSKYWFVSLMRPDGFKQSRMVHILVAQAFLGPQPTPEHIVSHEDDDPHNCRATNLKWRTGSENTELARARGRFTQGTDHHLSKLTDVEIMAIRSSTDSNRELARYYGVNASTISRIRSAFTHKLGGGRIKL